MCEADGVVLHTPAVVPVVLPDTGALPPVAEGAERVLIMAGVLATLLRPRVVVTPSLALDSRGSAAFLHLFFAVEHCVPVTLYCCN